MTHEQRIAEVNDGLQAVEQLVALIKKLGATPDPAITQGVSVLQKFVNMTPAQLQALRQLHSNHLN